MSTSETIELYAGLISKPTLTEQLLSRPPFKFIVDIVTNIIKSTGYLKDEFDKDELAAAGTDKTSKAAFLDKLISLLNNGDLENVKSAKIIAGKDPEDTNKLLQKLAKNAKNSGGGEKEKKKKSKDKDKDKDKEKDTKEKKSSSKEKSSERKSKRDSISTSSDEKKKEKREKSKSKDEKEKSSKKSSSSSSKERHKSKEKKSSEENGKSEKKKKDKVLKRGDSMIAINGDVPHTPNEDRQDEGYDEQEGPSNVMIMNDSADSSSLLQAATSPVKTDDSGMGDDSPRPPPPAERAALLRQATGAARPMTSMGRPGTAASRPAPPKIKKKQIAVVDSTPQPVIELKSEIITDGPTKEEDENNFVMEEDEVVDAPVVTSETVDEEDRGALVQKIMEKKAELEDGAANNQNADDGDETTAIEREKVRQLQDKLQDLTKTAYPLARLFDFANDDIETMIKELEKWRIEQRKNELDEQNKKAAGLGDSSRLYEMISNLQRDIKDIKDELSAARGRVLANEDKIKLLVSNI
ncbi:unnamed protein product [Caenorhabditis angaria]|uniref:TRAF3-interacting protein 1 N-terminal domain-containing protein n=1 Tax=Caenorhabditis angaria TaxID=860376 RepID=A0A9P1N8G4_9PELO|nr:unnamed protein product [Caenorhabditis angaria]